MRNKFQMFCSVFLSITVNKDYESPVILWNSSIHIGTVLKITIKGITIKTSIGIMSFLHWKTYVLLAICVSINVKACNKWHKCSTERVREREKKGENSKECCPSLSVSSDNHYLWSGQPLLLLFQYSSQF